MPLDRFKILHFATHGLLAQDPECLPEPGLVTSLGAAGDGLLEASEIVDLHLDAELVVMSACDTGAGAGQAASELIGFRGAGGLMGIERVAHRHVPYRVGDALEAGLREDGYRFSVALRFGPEGV